MCHPQNLEDATRYLKRDSKPYSPKHKLPAFWLGKHGTAPKYQQYRALNRPEIHLRIPMRSRT